MLKAVIFDLDGVLIDSEPFHFEVEREMFRELGLDISPEVHHSFVGALFRDIWESIKETYKVTVSIEELEEIKKKKYFDLLRRQKKLEPIPGASELIQDLSAKKILFGLASSSPRVAVDTVLHLLNFEKFFSIRMSADDVTKGKPDPEIFLRAAELLGVRPPKCLVIEDSRNGVQAAKRAGMKCAGFKNPNSGAQDLSSADLIIGSFSDGNRQKLLKLIKF